MPKPHTSPAGGAGGRPRDPRIDAAVLSATLEVLAESGYPGLSLEEVARRAGTSRPAIYRRWPGRARLALAAIGTRLDVPTPPDTGCTLCDLFESFHVFLSAYRTISPDVLSALYVDCAGDPELREHYLATITEPARRAVSTSLDCAHARGDLHPETDRGHLLDILASLVHYRAMFGPAHVSDAEAEQVIETLLRGAALDYPALLAHADELEEREHAPPHEGSDAR